MKRPFLKIYLDFELKVDQLNDGEKGRLLLALVRYAATGEIPELTGNEKFYLKNFIEGIDKDAVNQQKNRINGSKGGRPKGSKNKNKSLHKTEEKPTENPTETQINPTITQKNPNETQIKPKCGMGFEEPENPCESTVSADSVSTENADGAEKRVSLSPTPPITSEIYINNNIQPSLFDGEETEEVRDMGSGEKGKKKPKKRTKETGNAMFDELYAAYPKHEDRDYALKQFEKINPDGELFHTMLEAVERQKKKKQWQDVQYVPNLSTWLHKGKWKDEVPDELCVGYNANSYGKPTQPKSPFKPDGTYDYEAGECEEWPSLNELI